MDIVLFEMGDLGVEKRLDCIQYVYNFNIVEKQGFNYDRPWYTPGWGYVNNGYVTEEPDIKQPKGDKTRELYS